MPDTVLDAKNEAMNNIAEVSWASELIAQLAMESLYPLTGLEYAALHITQQRTFDFS